jgi:hypothetical protein
MLGLCSAATVSPPWQYSNLISAPHQTSAYHGPTRCLAVLLAGLAARAGGERVECRE